jgi:hypothetical protein
VRVRCRRCDREWLTVTRPGGVTKCARGHSVRVPSTSPAAVPRERPVPPQQAIRNGSRAISPQVSTPADGGHARWCENCRASGRRGTDGLWPPAAVQYDVLGQVPGWPRWLCDRCAQAASSVLGAALRVVERTS